ncbi:MAG TPA: hypothetical protein PKC69_00380 [Chitinophagaceae bacterium]|nr:hypothetical protein [Chitinophagaceae bacterium]
MDITSFQQSISEQKLPPGLSIYLQSLWHDAGGDWEKAHELVQDINDSTAAHIHAYLHRKEGDLFNANYWYRRAGKKRPAVPLREEWEQLVKELLS